MILLFILISLSLLVLLFFLSDDWRDIIYAIKEEWKVSIFIGIFYIGFLVYAFYSLWEVIEATAK